MAFLSRDFISAQLLRAFGLKTFQTDFSPTVVPQVQVMSLEQSAWPPFTSWGVTCFKAAAAAQFSGVNIGLSAAAPKYARVTCDQFVIVSGDTLVRCAFDFGTVFTGVTPDNTAIRTDVSNDIASAAFPIPQEPFVAGQNWSAAANQVQQTLNVPVVAATPFLWTPPFPFVLAPGQRVCFENSTVNLSLRVLTIGRLFVGQ